LLIFNHGILGAVRRITEKVHLIKIGVCAAQVLC